jgi:pimeloyl-ACP methyl ester carboxylesterase
MMPEIRYARTGPSHVAYQVSGEGPDLLWVSPGFIPVDAMFDEPHFARFLRRLATFSRVICFDRRGIGLSDPLAPSHQPTLEQWADDALAVLDAMGSSEATVFGSSEGGALAIRLAVLHPERIRALVLFGATARAASAPDYPFGMSPDFGAAFETGIRPDGGHMDHLAIVAPSAADDPRFRLWWEESGRRGASPATAAAFFRLAFEADLRRALPAIRIPTLVLQRRGDRFVTREHGRYLVEHIADARYVELPGEDHVVYLGDTTQLLDEVELFLTGNRHVVEPDEVVATVLMTDIVASTGHSVRLGDLRWRELIDRHDKVIWEELARFRGRLIHPTGDGILAVFDRPEGAIRCAAAVRDAVRVLGIEIRAGVHTGTIILRGNDVAGITVTVAARVAALAGVGEVWVSQSVVDRMSATAFGFSDRGEYELKGVPGVWRMFALGE